MWGGVFKYKAKNLGELYTRLRPLCVQFLLKKIFMKKGCVQRASQVLDHTFTGATTLIHIVGFQMCKAPHVGASPYTLKIVYNKPQALLLPLQK